MTKRFFQKKKIEDNPLFHNELPDKIILKTDKSKKTLKDLTDLNKKQYELALLKQIKDGLYNPQIMVDTYEYIDKDGNLTQKAIDWLDEIGIIHPDYPVSFDNENVHVGVYFNNDDMKNYIENAREKLEEKLEENLEDIIKKGNENEYISEEEKQNVSKWVDEQKAKIPEQIKDLVKNDSLKDLNELVPINDSEIYFSFNEAVKDGNKIKLDDRNIPQEYKDILTIKNKKLTPNTKEENKYYDDTTKKLTKEGANLFKDMTGKTDKEVDELKNIALDEHIKRIQKEIKNIENFNVQNIENLNVDKINTMTYQKVEQLGKDLEKLISVRIEKNDLDEIVKQIKDEIKTDEALQPIVQKLNEVSEKLKDKNIPIDEIKKDLEEIKNINEQLKEYIDDENVYKYILSNPSITEQQKKNLMISRLPAYNKLDRVDDRNGQGLKKILFNIYDVAKDYPDNYLFIREIINEHPQLSTSNLNIHQLPNGKVKFFVGKEKKPTWDKVYKLNNILSGNDWEHIFKNATKDVIYEDRRTEESEKPEGQGLIRETLTSQANQKIQELTKRIDELEKVIFGVYKDVEKKTETLQNQIMNFNPAQLKHVDVNVHNDEFEPTEIEKNLNDIMKKRREDIEPSEDEEESEEWGEGLIDINKIIKQYEKGRDKIKKYILD